MAGSKNAKPPKEGFKQPGAAWCDGDLSREGQGKAEPRCRSHLPVLLCHRSLGGENQDRLDVTGLKPALKDSVYNVPAWWPKLLDEQLKVSSCQLLEFLSGPGGASACGRREKAARD